MIKIQILILGMLGVIVMETVSSVFKFIFEVILGITTFMFRLLKIPINKCQNETVRIILTIFAVPVSIVLTIAIPIAIIFGDGSNN